MSDNSEAQAIFAIFFSDCWAYAGLTLFVHDFLLTLGSEVTLFWMEFRASGASILFLFNRYLTLTTQVVGVTPIPVSPESANAVNIGSSVLFAMQYLPWASTSTTLCSALPRCLDEASYAVFSAIRSYALCAQSCQRLVSTFVFVLSALPGLMDLLVNAYWTHIVNDPAEGVVVVHTLSPSTIVRLTVAMRCSLIASDIVVLYLSWYRARMPAQSPLHHAGKPTFASILLLDGTAYFLMLLILNLLHVAFTVSAVADVSSGPTSVIGTFEQPFTSLLIGRFLISLQKVQRRLCDSTRSISLGDFASQSQGSRNTGDFIGALGAQPSFHEDHEEAEESDSL